MSFAEVRKRIPRRYRHHFDDAFVRAHEQMEQYTGLVAREILVALLGDCASPQPKDDLIARADIAAEAAPLLEWVIAFLYDLGEMEQTKAGLRLRPTEGLASRSELRSRAIAEHPGVSAAYKLVDRCAENAPSVLRGHASGEDLLFDDEGTALWLAYFNNENALYAVNNRLTAQILVEELEAIGGRRVLELGGGGGSAALAFIDAAVGRDAQSEIAYTFTEPVPQLLSRAEHCLTARRPNSWELALRPADFERPLVAQGLASGGWDAVLAVNTLHVSTDLTRSLGYVRSLLRRGGVLVLGECVRPFPGQPIYSELIFQFLKSYREIETGPHRSRPGFLAPEEWVHHLLAAGFGDIRLAPDIPGLRIAYPKADVATIIASVP